MPASITSRLRSQVSRASRAGRRLLLAPRPTVETGPPLIRLGSEYGGWYLEDRPELRGATIVSCGLGEDASFDVEFASRYGARVIIVDPTPRAIAHLDQIREHLGSARARPYPAGGRMPVDAYDLVGIAPHQLELVQAALSDRRGTARFFAPPDPAHVSYSLINFQHGYAQDTASITVDTVTVADVTGGTPDPIPLMKLDIEGAEIDVIPQMLDSGVRPTQLLVEFDELTRPSRRSTRRFRTVHEALRSSSYVIRHFDRRSNFLFVRADDPAPGGRRD